MMVKIRSSETVPFSRYFCFCNALCRCNVRNLFLYLTSQLWAPNAMDVVNTCLSYNTCTIALCRCTALWLDRLVGVVGGNDIHGTRWSTTVVKYTNRSLHSTIVCRTSRYSRMLDGISNVYTRIRLALA